MSDLNADRALIFRITHRDNVPWILQHGLHCRNSGNKDANYHEIGNPELISKRSHREVVMPPGGTLSDYIPFYFTPHSPMLLNIKTGYGGMKATPMSEIVILVSSLRKVAELGLPFLFSDRHAYLQTAQFFSELSNLKDNIDWKILQERDFKRVPDDPGKFERYQAEALIYRRLPADALLGMVCKTQQTKEFLDEAQKPLGISLKTVLRPDWYF